MAAEPGRIEAKLSAFDAAMVVVSLVVGVGIFRTPALVARGTATRVLFLAAWAVGGIVSLAGALVFAEIGSRRPRAGGYYRVVAECYHPALAFMLNWAEALMQGAGAAGVAFIGAEYAAPLLLPAGWRGARSTLALSLSLMVLLLALNFAGIRTGSRTQNLLSLSKIALIAGLAAAALALVPPAAPARESAPAPFFAFLAALVPVFYTYGGYQMTMNLGADIRQARRRFPLAVAGGMGIVVGIYLLLNYAYVRALGRAGVAGSSLVAASLARACFGPAGEAAVSVAIFLSAAGFVNATILQMPRTFYAMAQDRVLPGAFLRVNPKTQVQEAGLLFFAATMLVPAFVLGSFEKLLNYVMFTDSATLAVVASTIFLLRRRGAGGGEAFRMPGYPVVPAVYLLCLAGICASVVATQPGLAAAGTLIFLTGAPLFRLGRRLSGGAI